MYVKWKNPAKDVRVNPGDSCLYVPMNIQVAVLCDAATQDSSSKLNVLGAFDTIFAPQLPAVHLQCTVALRVTFNSGDEGQHKLALNFINADGRSIMPPIEIPVAVAMPEDAHFISLNFVVNIQQVQFPEAGLYSVDIRLDGQSQAGIPLLVKLVQRPAA
jgi:hypothetical protein